MAAVLRPAFGNIDRVMTGVSKNSGLDSLAALLIPVGAPDETKAADVANRLIACLPMMGAGLGALQGNGQAFQTLLSELQALFADPPNAPTTKPAADDDTQSRIQKGLTKVFQNLGGDAPAAMQLHDTLSQMTADSMQTMMMASTGWTAGQVRDLLQKQSGK